MDLEQEIERIAKEFGDETCPTLEDWEKSLKNKLREMAAFTRKQIEDELKSTKIAIDRAAAPLSAPICKNCGHHKNYHCHGRLSELIKGNCCCGGYEPLKAGVASSPSPISNESLLGMQSVERNTGGEAQRDPRPSPSPTQLAIDLEKAKQWLDVEIAKSAECPNVQAFMTMSHAYLAHVLAAYASHSNSELLERVQKLKQIAGALCGRDSTREEINEGIEARMSAIVKAKAPDTRNV